MTRTLNSATETASQADVIAPIFLVELAFDSETVYFHSWVGDLDWNGNTYTGAGPLGGISRVEEDSELSRTPLALRLSGLDPAVTSAVLNEHYQGRDATIRIGYLDTDSMQLVGDPAVFYKGRMDSPAVTQDKTLEIVLNVESRFASWDRPNVRRYNNADQQSRYPGDRGLEFVEQSTEKRLVWGA